MTMEPNWDELIERVSPQYRPIWEGLSRPDRIARQVLSAVEFAEDDYLPHSSESGKAILPIRMSSSFPIGSSLMH